MKIPSDTIWNEPSAKNLASALTLLTNQTDMENFLRDVLTQKEITEISSRLQAAQMLQAGETYVNIADQTQLSSRTIARISDWLKQGYGGYEIALSKTAHPHILPAHAD